MKKMATCALAVAGLAAVAVLSPAHAALIANGSFETPLAPVGSFTNFPNGSALIPGWTTFGPQVSIVNQAYTASGVHFPAQDGAQWLDLTGDVSNTIEGVQQTVTTIPGEAYALSFYIGNVSTFGPGLTSTVGVLINGALLTSRTNATPGSTLSWQSFIVPFTAASTSTLIGFENLDPANDNSNGLDNVSLALADHISIPEPATLALFGVALAGLATLRRRRNV